MSLPVVLTELLDLMPEATAAYTKSGDVVYANDVTLATFGTTREAFVGQNLWKLYPDAIGNAFHAAFVRVAETGRAERNENYYAAWGRTFENRFYVHHGYVFVIAQDITEEKASAKRLEVLASVSRTLAEGGLDLSAIFDRIVRALTPAVGDCAGLYLADENGGGLVLHAVADVDPEREQIVREALAGPGRMAGSVGERVFETGVAERLTGVVPAEHAKRFRSDALQSMVEKVAPHSILVAPMTAGGHRLGVLSVVRRRPRSVFTDGDLDLLRDLADRTALSVANAASFERAEAALRLAKEASLRKDEFLAMLGHELRNPLAPIATALSLMEMRGVPGIERERTIIARQVESLKSLVDDLLDVTRITAGKVTLTKTNVELSEIVTRALEAASPLFEEREQRVNVDVPRTGLTMHVDENRMAQVLSNLLTNAAKYTDARGTISITARREGERVTLRVRDSGVGIDPSMVPRVFELFAQERQGLDRSHGGLGLGLAIVRSLIEMHGGRVGVRSEGRGRGSEFWFELPLASKADAKANNEFPEATRHPRSKVERVLVVDDNQDAADMLAEMLRVAGHATCTAYDGPTALRLLPEFAPTVALLDIGLPVMDGYELAERIRLMPQGRALRLVAVTGYGQEEDRRRALDAGFDEHVVKPLSLETALSLVAEPDAVPHPP